MGKLITKRAAPKNAIVPLPIDAKGIWDLDVDDDIWQDVGLDDTYDNSVPPLWLSNENMRRGIRAMLELDRAREEWPCLLMECRSLRWYSSEEWAAVSSAHDMAMELGEPIDFGQFTALNCFRSPRRCLSAGVVAP
jgi:hypothetical protein